MYKKLFWTVLTIYILLINYWLWLRIIKSIGGSSENFLKPLSLQRYGPATLIGDALNIYNIL